MRPSTAKLLFGTGDCESAHVIASYHVSCCWSYGTTVNVPVIGRFVTTFAVTCAPATAAGLPSSHAVVVLAGRFVLYDLPCAIPPIFAAVTVAPCAPNAKPSCCGEFDASWISIA